MTQNLQQEQQEIQQIKNSFDVFKQPPRPRQQNPRLGKLNPNFMKGDEREKENQDEPLDWSNAKDRDNDNENVSPNPSFNPNKQLSKQAMLQKRKQVNDY